MTFDLIQTPSCSWKSERERDGQTDRQRLTELVLPGVVHFVTDFLQESQ